METNAWYGRFYSSRNSENRYPFWESIDQGTAEKDFGLLMPAQTEPFDATFFNETLPNLKEHEVGTIILRQFIPEGEIDDQRLADMMQRALSFEMPLEQMDKVTHLLRLDQGPTASFKDIGARTLAELMSACSEKLQRHISIVVATSGDTGVAIADAFNGMNGTDVTVLYPQSKVSIVQEKQLLDIHSDDGNVQVLPLLSAFSQCQNAAKLLLASRGLEASNDRLIESLIDDARQYLHATLFPDDIVGIADSLCDVNLSSANSINIWRLLPQITEYFVAYGKMMQQGQLLTNQELTFAVPCANLGHVTAGLLARRMGLPMKHIIAGTNANNLFDNILRYGTVFHNGQQHTCAPAMDIDDPSNLERVLRIAAEATSHPGYINFAGLKKAVSDNTGMPMRAYGVSDAELKFLRNIIWSYAVESNAEIESTMHECNATHRVVLDPHGACAARAQEIARQEGAVSGDQPIVVFGTAHPDKFPDTLERAGIELPGTHIGLRSLRDVSLPEIQREGQSVHLPSIAQSIQSQALRVCNI